MKKKLNTDAIENELRELSPFFKRAQPKATAVSAATAARPHNQPATRALEGEEFEQLPYPHQERPLRTPRASRTSRTPRTALPSVKRHMKRHAFEIYFDQYDSLVRLAAKERLRGGVGSMSQMVREAIDRLIAERRGEEAA
jgi:hypothetical protein